MTELLFRHYYEPAPGADRRTVLLLHGPAGDEHELLPLARALQPTAGILAARGQIADGGAWRFFRRLEGGPADLGDMQRRATQLALFLAGAARHYRFDSREVVAIGFSDGANIASTMLLGWPETLAGAVLFRGSVPAIPPGVRRVPGTPVLVSNGRHDPVVLPDDTEGLAAVLRSAGAAVTVRLQAAAQQMVADDLEEARAWFTSCGTLRSPLRMS